MSAWRESNHDDDELEDFFSREMSCFLWTDSDDDSEFGPRHFRDLVALALLRLVQNPYWTHLWIIHELAVSPIPSTLHWGDSSVPLQTVLTLAHIFCKKVLDGGSFEFSRGERNFAATSIENHRAAAEVGGLV